MPFAQLRQPLESMPPIPTTVPEATLLAAAVGGFLAALLLTAALTPAVRRLALARGWGLDLPDGNRKLHTRPTPAVGGVAVAAGFAAALALVAAWTQAMGEPVGLMSPVVWLGALVMLATGLYDDLRGLGFKAKFAVQVLVAYALVYAGFRIDVTVVPVLADLDPYHQALVAIPLTILWIVGVVNALNLLDGLDGLAAGVALIAFAAMGLVFGTHGEMGLVLVALAVSGALVGFLIYNFNPASIFMGDSGSLFLGYLLATYAIAGVDAVAGGPDPWLGLLVPAVALGLPLLDTSLSIVRRLRERRAVFAPDRDHIHHRMAARYPTRGAVLRLYSAAFVFGVSSYLISLLPAGQALGVLLLTGFLVAVWLHRLGYHRRSVQPTPACAPRVDVIDVEVSGDGHYREAVVSATTPN